MLIKPLVLNCYSGINHRLRNFIQRCPLAVGGGIDLLKLLNISVIIYIINKGSPLQVIVIHRPVACFRQNIILKVITQSSYENRAANQNDQQYGCRRTDCDFHKGQGQRSGGIHQLDQPVGIPLLPGLFPSPLKNIVFCHRDTSIKSGQYECLNIEFSGFPFASCRRASLGILSSAHDNTDIIIAYPFPKRKTYFFKSL